MATALHDGDLAPEATEHLREFESHVSGAEHDEMPGDTIQLHDAGGIQKRHLLHPRNVQDGGAVAGIHEDPLGFQHRLLAALQGRRAASATARAGTRPVKARRSHRHRRRGYEASVSPEKVESRSLPQPLLHPRPPALDDVPLALPHRCQVDMDRSGPHAVVVRPPGEISHPGAGGHGLGGSAPLVIAGTSHMPALDERHPPAGSGEVAGERYSGLAGPDDDGVVPMHGTSPWVESATGLYPLGRRSRHAQGA